MRLNQPAVWRLCLNPSTPTVRHRLTGLPPFYTPGDDIKTVEKIMKRKVQSATFPFISSSVLIR
jgi:hypothetical protein|eukprot:COSAG01_NODE_18380_length_1079_cov_9.269388_2_plen_64_part_00